VRICFLCTDVDVPLLGDEGCSVKIRQFCDTLVGQGHEVVVLCAWLGESATARIAAPVHELRPGGADAAAWAALERDPAVLEANLERDLRSLFLNHWLQSEGARLLEDDAPDLVYERYALFGHAGAELARELGAAHLLEVNGPLCREQEGYEKFPLIRTAEALEPSIIRTAGAVVAVSPWVRDFAHGHGAAEVHLVPNGVAPSFERPASGATVRDRLGLGSRPVVGYVGSFQPWHDVDGLVEAFARLRHDARLLLVGHGPDRANAEALAARLGVSDRTVFTGHVDPDEVPSHVAAMDVAVAPYRDTADFYFSPLKLFECMASGTATVAARTGQIEDVVSSGENGLLYEPGDANSLASTVGGLLDDPRRAAALGAAGRELVLAEHTMAANAERVVALAERQLATA
jgi:glycosyltransferase involved in cell wall biosynthesis